LIISFQFASALRARHHYHQINEQLSGLQTAITGRLSDFACDLTAMIETIQSGRLQITDDEYKNMETASRDLAKTQTILPTK
jgi:hypothetical protein